MLGSFLIFLREGIEGSMIITVMCTCLVAAGRRDLIQWILAGAAAAVLAAAALGTGMYLIAADAFVDSRAQLWFETFTFCVAVAVLTYMTFWMKRHARQMTTTLREQLGVAAMGGSGAALVVLAFVTVGREAIETAIFLLAIAFHSSAVMLLTGAVAGLAIALSLSLAVFKLGVRVNMRRFFTWMGAALLIVAAGLLANAISNLQELGVLPDGGATLWNSTALLPDDSGLGDILHGLLGYSSAPSLLQGVAWLLFLTLGLWAFLFQGSGGSKIRPSQAVGSH